MLNKDNKNEIQTKVVQLFTYLEKVLSLEDVITRDFRETTLTPSPWWLADLPKDVDNLYIKQFETERNTPEQAQDEITAWLRVEKKDIEPMPLLPDPLIEWLGEVTPLSAPHAKEKIDREIAFNDNLGLVKEFKTFKENFKHGDEVPVSLKEWVTVTPGKLPELIETRYIEDLWKDHKELYTLLEGYISTKWTPWAEKVVKIYKANLLYDQLYALRLLLKNEGDSCELLLGHGVITWKHSSVGTIFAPIFLTPLTLDFDSAKRIIEISPDPLSRSFTEISSLYDMGNQAEADITTWSDKINAEQFDFWHLETMKMQLRTLANYISPDSEDHVLDEMSPSPEITKNLGIWNSPVIFVRKRTNDLWSKYAGIIRRDIEQNNIEPTEFISDLVGEYETENNQQNGEEGGGTEQQNISIKESELFFPLPWNDEQKRIAERLDTNYGVVVKGPPGTGKSHTIANLISRFLAEGKTVLVTSQTSKALDVLRDKLPINIRSLAVTQLQQTSKKDDVLQQSIGEISSNLGERQTKFSEEKALAVRRELHQVRSEKASVANLIRKYILTDSQAKITIEDEDIKPISAAKLINKHKNSKDTEWFTDTIAADINQNFTTNDLSQCYSLLLELTPEERKLYKFTFPELDNLPTEDAALGAFASYREFTTKAKTSKKVFSEKNPDFTPEQLSETWEMLLGARSIFAALTKDYEWEILKSCQLSENERSRWQTVLTKLNEQVSIIVQSQNVTLGHTIDGDTSLSLNERLEAVTQLKQKVANGAKISALGKLLLSSKAKKILDSYKIDDYVPNNEELVEILYQHIIEQKAKKDIETIFEQSFYRLKSFSNFFQDGFNLVKLEVFITNVERLVNYTISFAEIDTFCNKITELSKYSYTKKEDIEKIIEIVASSVATIELNKLEILFYEWEKQVVNGYQVDGELQSAEYEEEKKIDILGEAHPFIIKLLGAIKKRHGMQYKEALSELILLENKKKQAIELEKNRERISKYAPQLYKDIVDLAKNHTSFEVPENLDLVWKIARLQSWLNTIHDHTDIDDLQHKLDRLTKREQQLNSEFVTILAWQRQIDKVTKSQRDALMAWSHEMKQYGKGTGKYAGTHLRSAQNALKEAKDAVPVWIMPIHRVAQMFPEPKAGMFDVVIFDEASQCDIKGLTVGYLGKKLLVVGDPEQISPAGKFQNQEKIFELISRYLHDIPHKESFSVTSSMFDLARIRLSNIIQLNEHFRCVPEIINFSNHYIYESKLKPLRYPHPKWLLKPALVPIYIDNGYENTNNKINEPEAKRIVEKLLELIKDPKYQIRLDGKPCTFGIISLLATDQAKYIEKLLRDKISEKVMEERKIECGDAYKFQGDERDVILLSMVKSPDPNNINATIMPLVKEDAKQRFNVAASRARDQMFLFHSIPLESFKNQNDWRYKLLNWFYNPKSEELKAGREALKKEFDAGRASQFSFDVGNLLIDRGYQVLPEYEVIGRRIDLVVQGAEARLAVECDGDQYHTLETFEEDQARENQLRRAGWEFWRISGSSFYQHKEKALDSLWKQLEEMGIKPINQ
jgi:hypothetical protein